jgi:hypothetical protein
LHSRLINEQAKLSNVTSHSTVKMGKLANKKWRNLKGMNCPGKKNLVYWVLNQKSCLLNQKCSLLNQKCCLLNQKFCLLNQKSC